MTKQTPESGPGFHKENQEPQEDSSIFENIRHSKFAQAAALSTVLAATACERGVNIDTKNSEVEVRSVDSPEGIKDAFDDREDQIYDWRIQATPGYNRTLYDFEDTTYYKIGLDGVTDYDNENKETPDNMDTAEDIEAAVESGDGVFVRFKKGQLSRGVYDRPLSNIEDLWPNTIERESIETDQTEVLSGESDIGSELVINAKKSVESRDYNKVEAVLEALKKYIRQNGDKDNVKEVEEKITLTQDYNESDSANNYTLENVIIEYGGLIKNTELNISESSEGPYKVTLSPKE